MASLPTFVIVVEDDDLVDLGVWLAHSLRLRNVASELLTTGSPRKRFDKALKLNPESVISLNSVLLDNGQLANMRVKRLRKEAAIGIRKYAGILEEAVRERFRADILMGSAIDSGSDVKLFEKSPAS